MGADLTVAVADGVALLTLNRPERRNAYTAEMGDLLNPFIVRLDVRLHRVDSQGLQPAMGGCQQ